MPLRGQSTAVGGIFFVILSIIVLSSLLIYIDKLYSIELEAIHQIRQKTVQSYGEEITFELSFTREQYLQPSTYTTLDIVTGSAQNLDPTRLDDLDNVYITVTSAKISPYEPPQQVVEGQDMIINGNFEDPEVSKYWSNSSNTPYGQWEILTINQPYNRVAAYVLSIPRFSTVRGIGNLSQTFNAPSVTDIINVTLKIDAAYTGQSVIVFYRSMYVYINEYQVLSEELDLYSSSNPTLTTYTVAVDKSLIQWGSSNTIKITVFLEGFGLGRTSYLAGLIDNVKLIVYYVSSSGGVEALVLYVADVRVNTSADNLVNYTGILTLKLNASALLRLYVLDGQSGVWKLYDQYFIETTNWINISLPSNVCRLYFSSAFPFEVYFDYLENHAYLYDDQKVKLIVYNDGNSPAMVVSMWVLNSTDRFRIAINTVVMPKENLTKEINNIFVRGNEYIVKIVTTQRVYYKTITVP